MTLVAEQTPWAPPCPADTLAPGLGCDPVPATPCPRLPGEWQPCPGGQQGGRCCGAGQDIPTASSETSHHGPPMAQSRAAPGGLEAGNGLRLSPRVGTSQVTAGSRGQAHGEPQQCRRYASRRQLVVFHVGIVLKCQRGKGFNAASPVRNARDSSQRPGRVLITGSAETVQPQRASSPDLLRGGWLARRRASAPFPLLAPPVVPGRALRPPSGSSPPAPGRGH